jgi:Flp pilus assembly protein TadG
MRPQLFKVVKDPTGSAMVEFAIVLPVLTLLILGLAQFGLLFYNYTMVANAAATGARQLSISRWDSTAYTDTMSAINNAAGGLSGLTVTMSVDGTACATDSACYGALKSAPVPSSSASTPWPSSVTVSYSCSANSIMPAYLISLAGICPLTSTMQQLVQ